MSHRIPSLPNSLRTGKVLTNRGRLIETILKIHNEGLQRRRVQVARAPQGSPGIEARLSRDGATGA